MYLSALIPILRPSHCPYLRISNESLPTPADNIYTYTTAIVIPGYTYPRNPPLGYIRKERAPLKGVHLIIYIKGNDSRRRDIKSTHVDASCCITAVSRFKFARFDSTDSNVKKTSFRDWPYKWPEVSFHRC